MNNYNINPLEESISKEDLEDVDYATLVLWRNKLLDEISVMVSHKDYSHPLIEEWIRNLDVIIGSMSVKLYRNN